MTANWEDLVAYYGSEINVHKDSLSKAHRVTYAMLACKWSENDPARNANCSGEHAEERLVESSVWTDDRIREFACTSCETNSSCPHIFQASGMLFT